MEKFQQAIDARKDFVSCAFVVLMAHGQEGHLKGMDEQMVKLVNLFEVLNNKNCQALRAKPKVYIVQACRGGEHRAKNTELWSCCSPIPELEPQLSLGLLLCLMTFSIPQLSL